MLQLTRGRGSRDVKPDRQRRRAECRRLQADLRSFLRGPEMPDTVAWETEASSATFCTQRWEASSPAVSMVKEGSSAAEGTAPTLGREAKRSRVPPHADRHVDVCGSSSEAHLGRQQQDNNPLVDAVLTAGVRGGAGSFNSESA
jgi:hypothetical protein